MRLPPPPAAEIRDPVHGAIPVAPSELAVIDHPFVQRLRGIRQLGFSHLAFPGATHTRYIHSLGAMHLAGLAFDAVFSDNPFSSDARRDALRRCARLAALCHDLGHPPFSHAAEFAMPPLRALGITAYAPERVARRLDRRATHEDYTVAIVTKSELAGRIREESPFGPEHVAALVSGEVAVTDDFFIEDGVDLRGLLSQIISSELDVDRLDYLVRDSMFTGARYGLVDVPWLTSHMTRHVEADGQARLALDSHALYAFDDYIIARFHMFVMVYFHQKSIAYELLLRRYMESESCDYRLPADVEAYRHCDDGQLWDHLRRADDPWAQRVVRFEPFGMALESNGTAAEAALPQRVALLQKAGIDAIPRAATGVLLRPRKPGQPPIYVIDDSPGGGRSVRLLEDATRAFAPLDHTATISRIYVPPEDVERARVMVRDTWSQQSLIEESGG
jgi:uncharacterized protein